MRQITLNIGGKDRDFYFGLGFLGNLLEYENVSAADIGKKIGENPYMWIPTAFYYSCAYGYEKQSLPLDFTKDNFSEWIDDLGLQSEEVKSFLTAFYQSLTKNVPENPDKKKVTKKSTGRKT